VLVSLDTTRADRIGAYGADGAHTPTLDALAARGTRFAEAIAPTPMTQPSHASLFTAVEPPTHGLRTNGSAVLRDDLPTLAEHLERAGYATAAFVGALVLEAQFGFARGFGHYDDTMERRVDGTGVGRVQRRADAVVDAALGWLETAPQRFFLFVHLFDPHEPYDAPSLLARLRADSAYDAEITYADRHLGRLLDTLAERWSDGSTLVAVTSDHGESLGEHGEPTHSYSVYEATQHVPLLFAGPGVPPQTVVEGPVRLVDVAPTLLALAGAEALPDGQGRDLRDAWSTPDPWTGGPAYVETLATRTDFGWSPLYGLRTATHKYIRAPRPELYDLREDPAELHDLAEDLPEQVRELDAALGRYLERIPTRSPKTATLDERSRRRLQELGYIVSDADARDDPPDPLGRVGGPDPKDHLEVIRSLEEVRELAAAGRPLEALRVLEGNDASPLVSSERAHLALLAGHARLAERHAREAIESGPDTFHAWARLGSALAGQDRLEEAEAAYRTARALNPAAPEPLLGLGVVAERRGRPRQAASFYQRALLTKLLSAEARWRLAALRIEQGRAAEAQRLLAQVDERALLVPQAALRLAQAELRAGRPDDALERLDRSLAEFPDSEPLAQAREQIAAR